jgi:predicted permease
LIRPLAAECVLLATAGGGLGIVVAQWTSAFMAHRLGGEGSTLQFVMDGRVLAFAFLAALVTGLLFGITPAWLVSRVRVNEALKSGTRGSTSDRSHQRYRQALIVAQFALALILLSGATVFFRGIDRLLSRESGWDSSTLVTGKISITSALAREPERSFLFYRQIRERLAALPGVTQASVDVDLPIYGFPGPRGYMIEGAPPAETGLEPLAYTNPVMPEYFATVGTHLRQGRGIAATDTLTAPPVVVINDSMARTLFPQGDAIGKRIARMGDPTSQWAEIVGIAQDVDFKLISGSSTPFQVYKPLSQETWGYVSVTLRASDPAAAAGLVEPMRKAIAELDPDLPIMNLAPVRVGIERSMGDLKMIKELLTAFAALGLFLAALGIYGVIARTVLQRTSEIGIRMALGAQLRDVINLILRSGLRMVALGTGLGLIGAVLLSRVLASAMPGIAAESSGSILIAAGLLAIVALLACYLPARRATKVDPLTALRAE